MKNPFGRELESGSSFGVSGGAAMEFSARGQELRPGRTMDGAVDTSTAEQRGVGCIHDRVDLLFGDVALDSGEFGHLESPALTIHHRGWMAGRPIHQYRREKGWRSAQFAGEILIGGTFA